MQPHKQWCFIWKMNGFQSSCRELSWCWVRTFPICCMWQEHRKRPAGILTLLLAGDFAIKAGEGDGKGLYGTQGIPVVQSESIVCNSPKLHHNVVNWNIAQKMVMQTFIHFAIIINVFDNILLHSVYCTLCMYYYIKQWKSMHAIWNNKLFKY